MDLFFKSHIMFCKVNTMLTAFVSFSTTLPPPMQQVAVGASFFLPFKGFFRFMRGGPRGSWLSKQVMAEEGGKVAAKAPLTAAEKQLLRRRQELDYWKKNAERIRGRNLMTGLAIGAFVVGMCILHRPMSWAATQSVWAECDIQGPEGEREHLKGLHSYSSVNFF